MVSTILKKAMMETSRRNTMPGERAAHRLEGARQESVENHSGAAARKFAWWMSRRLTVSPAVEEATKSVQTLESCTK